MIRLDFLRQGTCLGLLGEISFELSDIDQARIPYFLLLPLPVIDLQGIRIIFLRHQQIEFLLVQVSLNGIPPKRAANFQQIRQDEYIHRLFVNAE